MGEHMLVITTCDDADAATRLGESLVEARLAACVQVVGPIRSIYRWEGAVTSSAEWQLHVKTSADRVEGVTEHIVARHGYDVPEVIAVPVVGGSRAYLDWVTAETR